MTRIRAEALSRKDIRDLAHKIRDKFGLTNCLYFPIVEVLDILSEYFGIHYEIVEDYELSKTVHADTDPNTGHIRIKESVYKGAINGQGRDRFTIAHEIGHALLLWHFGIKFTRVSQIHPKIPAYEDPEWHASCFAGELLMDNRLIFKMTLKEISQKCGVSLNAAEIQLKKVGE